jgi:hypothetical protein
MKIAVGGTDEAERSSVRADSRQKINFNLSDTLNKSEQPVKIPEVFIRTFHTAYPQII